MSAYFASHVERLLYHRRRRRPRPGDSTGPSLSLLSSIVRRLWVQGGGASLLPPLVRRPHFLDRCLKERISGSSQLTRQTRHRQAHEGTPLAEEY